QEITADTCSVVAGPSMDVDSVARDAEAFAGVSGRSGLAIQKSARGYLWSDLNGNHELLPPEQLAAHAPQVDVKMLDVMSLEDSVVLQLFVPAADKADRRGRGSGEAS